MPNFHDEKEMEWIKTETSHSIIMLAIHGFPHKNVGRGTSTTRMISACAACAINHVADITLQRAIAENNQSLRLY